MSSYLINGAKYALAEAIAAAVPITAISNADPAVASTTTPPVTGSVVILDSGWPELNESVHRVGAVVAATSFAVEDYDTTDLARFPAGEGAGAFKVASGFFGLDQVRDITYEGGEQQFFEFQYVEDASGRRRRKPINKSAAGFQIMLDYDPDRPWFAKLIEMDRKKFATVMRETLVSGDVIYHYGYVSFNKEPTKGLNENMTVMATFSPISESVRYAAAP